MAATKLADLKTVFAGLNEVRYYANKFTVGSDGTVTIGADYKEMPCTVDTFNFSQAAPTINHYKVVGLSVDWASASQAGDTEISLNVPSFADELLTLFWGADNVKSAKATFKGGNFTGSAVTLKKHKVTGAFVLINEAEDAVLILNDVGLYATATNGDADTAPYYINLAGSMEGQEDNIIFLQK